MSEVGFIDTIRGEEMFKGFPSCWSDFKLFHIIHCYSDIIICEHLSLIAKRDVEHPCGSGYFHTTIRESRIVESIAIVVVNEISIKLGEESSDTLRGNLSIEFD